MSVPATPPAVRLTRLRLTLTSALTSAVAGALAAPAAAQTLPTPRLPTVADVVGANPGGLLTGPIVASGNGRLDVVLRARNTVIDWRGFNIPENSRADFIDGRLVPTGAAAVLNRDVSGTASQLLGQLTSASNVAVWVYNPNGIIVGGKAAFATGSLVLTTLNPNETDFLAGGSDYRLTATTSAGQSAITVLNGAQIRVEGGNRGLVMVAPKIDADGRFEAVGQDVAFVTAADVTLSYAGNGPLSVTLRQGTAVPGTSQYVRGTVAGQDALFALASQGTITDALLRVDASVTTATAGTRGIVLSAGQPTAPVAGVTVAQADTGGIAGLQVGGVLTSTARDILGTASGTAAITGALSSGRDILLSAGGSLDVAGAVTAGRAYGLAGRGIGLGPVNATAPATVQSGGSVTATATDGDIVGRSALTLRSDATGAIALTTGGAAGGNILFAADTAIQAGADRGGLLTVRVRDAASRVTLGRVTARGVLSAVGTGPATNGLSLATALTVGPVDVVDPLLLNAAGITAGGLVSDGAVTLASTAALSTGPILARGGSATLSAGGAVTVTGGVTATGNAADVVVDGGGTIALAGLTAGRDVRVGGGTQAVGVGDISAGGTVALSGGTLTLRGTQLASGRAIDLRARTGGIATSGAVAISSTSTRGDDFVRLQATGAGGIVLAPGSTIVAGANQALRVAVFNGEPTAPLALGSVTGRSLGGLTMLDGDPSQAAGAIVGGGSMVFGALNLVDGFAAESTGGDLTVAPVTVTGAGQGVSLRAARALRVQGTLSAGGDVTLAAGGGIATGAIAAGTGRVVVDGGTGVTSLGDVTAAGSAALRGGTLTFGAVKAGGLSAAAAGDLTGGGITVTGTASIDGAGMVGTGAVRAGGAVDLRGGSLSFGDVAGTSLTARATSGAATGATVTVDTSASVTAATTIDLGQVAVTRGAATLDSGGRMAVAGVTAGGGASLTTRGTAADILLANGLDAADSVTVAATGSIRAPFIRSRAGDLTISAPTGEATGVDPASTIALSAGAGRAFALTLGAAARLGDVIAGRIAVAATSISAGRVDAGTGPVTLQAIAGDLLVSGAVSGGAVTLGATGRTVLADVSAGGALVLNGGTSLTFGEIGGTSIAGRSGGGIGGAAARTGGVLDLVGAALSLREAQGQSVTLRATAGELALTTLTAAGDAALTATGTTRLTGAATIGGNLGVTGAGVALGGGAVVQRANGTLRVTATGGDITGVAGLTLIGDADATGGEALVLDAMGGIDLAGVRLRAGGGGGAVLGLRAGSGRAVRLGAVDAATIGNFDGSRVASSFGHDGDLTVGDVTATTLSLALSAGNLATGRVTTTGAVSLRASTGTLTTGDLRTAALELTSGGTLTAGSIDARGAASLAGGAVTLGSTSAAALTVRTAGALGGPNGGRPSLTTTAGDLSIEGGAVRVGAVASAGAANLSGTTIDVAGRLAAARSLLVQARQSLSLRDAGAGTDLTVRSDGTIATGSLEAAGTLSATGAGVTIDSARSSGKLALVSTRALTLGSGTAANGVAIDAAGLVTLGAVTGGPAITVAAADAQLSGPIRAASVTFTNKTPTAGALRLGDDAGDGGFSLSQAEIGQIAADTLRFDAGAGSLAVGALALAPVTGRVVDLVSTGTIRVTGALSAAGVGRTIRLGGGDANAAAITVVATGAGGGRLLLDGADLELRADRIAVGLGPGFIDTLPEGDAGRTRAAELIGNGNSALYNPQLGGGFYESGATTLVQARSLTVRFGDYALFQNTGLPGQTAGLVLGGTAAAPVMPALRVATSGPPAKASFALFGTLNGIDGASAALLGTPVLDIDPALLPNSRINGCLAGSGAGCLTTIVIQPTLQVFDFDSEDVFGISQDVAVPFAPVVGGNNEELLGDLPELLPQGELGGILAPPLVSAEVLP